MGDHVTMRTKEGPDDRPTSRTTREAFDEVWAPKGWVEVDPIAAQASTTLGKPVDEINKLSREDLRSFASQTGVPVADDATKADIVTAVETALTMEGASNG